MNAAIRATFKCAFCNSLCHAIVSEEGDSGIIHEIPICESFEEQDIVTFLKNCDEINAQTALKPN